MQLRDKARNVSQSTGQTSRDAESIRKTAEEIKKVRSSRLTGPHTHWSQQTVCVCVCV